MKKIIIIPMLIISAVWCFAQTSFSIGEDLFMRNRPREAAPHLENSIAENPNHIEAFLYLGIVYEQIGRNDEAIAVYRQILSRAGEFTANIANNLGNVYFNMENFIEAEAMYTQALNADSAYAPAYLGRANTRIRRGNLRDAISDYEQYLLLNPRSGQRQSIERLTNYIRAEFAEAERRRLVAEEQARAEAERRQRLLDDITASLQSAAGASQGISSGAENIEVPEGEFELE
jgi:tetratricopeptide (TPR) repeat protein